jgi:hypothetical protein
MYTARSVCRIALPGFDQPDRGQRACEITPLALSMPIIA